MRTAFSVFLGVVFCISASAAIPVLINQQGVLQVDGEPVTGDIPFRFALINSDTGLNLWTNDGSRLGQSAPPDSPVVLSVNAGLYNVQLGDVQMPNMVQLPTSVFEEDAIALRIWVGDTGGNIQRLEPDQAISSVPYALYTLKAEEATHATTADQVTGLDVSALEESDEIDADIEAHNSNPNAHANLRLGADQITSGVFSLDRIPHGAGSGLDADTVDGLDATSLATVEYVDSLSPSSRLTAEFKVAQGEQILAGKVAMRSGGEIHRGKSSPPTQYIDHSVISNHIVPLSSTRFALVYRDSQEANVGMGIIVDVDDDSVTLGAPSLLHGSGGSQRVVFPLSSSSFALLYALDDTTIGGRVCQVEGTSISTSAELTADYGMKLGGGTVNLGSGYFTALHRGCLQSVV